MSLSRYHNKKIFFPNLDGVRFIAFMAVFLEHSGDQWTDHFPKFKNPGYRFIHFILNMGSEGVSLFFVLSGFLITYLIIKEKDTEGHFNVFFFYMRRILRTWPLYYLLLLLNFTAFVWLCQYLNWQPTPWNPMLVVFFLTNFNIIELHKAGVQGKSIIRSTWSVAIEEQFYLVWPLIFLLSSKKIFKYIFPSVIIFSYVFRFIYRHDSYMLYYHPFAVFGDLALGGMCAYYAYYSEIFKKFFKLLNKAYIILIYLFGIIWLFFVDETQHSENIYFLFRIISCSFFAFIIIEQNYSDNSFYKFSRNHFLSKWGKYTYGLYLLHYPVIISVRVLTYRLFPGFNPGIFIYEFAFRIVSLILSMAISYLSYSYFEQRFLKLKKRFEIIKTTSISHD
jgi:peptidoglycan/LPS O-acetylase OafA/YrhL